MRTRGVVILVQVKQVDDASGSRLWRYNVGKPYAYFNSTYACSLQ